MDDAVFTLARFGDPLGGVRTCHDTVHTVVLSAVLLIFEALALLRVG